MPEQIENRTLLDSYLEFNTPSVPPVKCDCGNIVYPGGIYYQIDGKIYCSECVNEAIEDFLFEHRKVVM